VTGAASALVDFFAGDIVALAGRETLAVGADCNLRVITAASAPSASTHAAPGLSPVCLSSVESGTPVHSDVETRPWVPCTVGRFAFMISLPVVPEHSRKYVRDTVGKRLRSASEYLIGRLTMPWMTRRCRAGSMFGIPPW
jgi:hypothetical protein